MFDAETVARRIGELYRDVGAVRMTLITGSYARALADEASDLDIYLYVDRLEPDTVARPRRLEPLGAKLVFGVPTASGWFDKYRLDGRFIDVECVDTSTLSDTAAALKAGEARPSVIKTAVGLRDAIAVDGADELLRWQHQLRFTDALAASEVRTRGARLLPVSAIFNLTYARGDGLSYVARVSQVLLDAVGLLGAVNRTFVPVDDPKWMPWHLDRLGLKPPGLADRIAAALASPTPATAADVDRLLDEILDLTEASVPDADTATARFILRVSSEG